MDNEFHHLIGRFVGMLVVPSVGARSVAKHSHFALRGLGKKAVLPEKAAREHGDMQTSG